MPDDDEAMTVPQACEALGVSVSTLWRWRRDRTGPKWKTDRKHRVRYLASSVRAWRERDDNPWSSGDKSVKPPSEAVTSARPGVALPTNTARDDERVPDFLKRRDDVPAHTTRTEHTRHMTYQDAEDASLAREIARSNFTLPERKPK